MKEELVVLKGIKKILLAILIVLTVLVLVLLTNAINNNGESSKSADTKQEETEENTEYDVSMFEEVDTSAFKEAFNSSELGIIYIGRPTCGYCVKFLPVLQQAQSELGYTTKYLDIEKVSEDEANEIKDMDDFLEENYGTTPLVILVKDGKLVDGHIGYAEYETFKEFLTNNGVK